MCGNYRERRRSETRTSGLHARSLSSARGNRSQNGSCAIASSPPPPPECHGTRTGGRDVSYDNVESEYVFGSAAITANPRTEWLYPLVALPLLLLVLEPRTVYRADLAAIDCFSVPSAEKKKRKKKAPHSKSDHPDAEPSSVECGRPISRGGLRGDFRTQSRTIFCRQLCIRRRLVLIKKNRTPFWTRSLVIRRQSRSKRVYTCDNRTAANSLHGAIKMIVT